jgi:hypothetical protein
MRNMWRKIAVGSAACAIVLAIGIGVGYPASAEWSGQGNSTPGGDRYNATKAHVDEHAPAAQCGSGAGSGAFGYFGKGMNLAGGANGYQTGLNNSAVCGNRP